MHRSSVPHPGATCSAICAGVATKMVMSHVVQAPQTGQRGNRHQKTSAGREHFRRTCRGSVIVLNMLKHVKRRSNQTHRRAG